MPFWSLLPPHQLSGTPENRNLKRIFRIKRVQGTV